MKKRILAAVLAAATAFSMFGASLSASAAIDDKGKYQEYNAVAATDATAIFENYDGNAFDAGGNQATNIDGLIKALERVNTETRPEIIDDADMIYVADYAIGTGELDKLISAMEDVYDAIYAIADYTDVEVADGEALGDAVDALVAAYQDIVNAADLQDKTIPITDGSSLRRQAYNRAVAAAKVMANVEVGMFSTGDYNYYGVGTLKNALVGAGKVYVPSTDTTSDGAGFTTSELLDMADSFEALNDFFGFSDLVDETALSAYEKKLEEVSNLVPDDFTSYNWARVEGYMNAADALASEGKYTKALEELKKIDTVPGKAADKTDLRATLKSLFTTSVSVFPNEYTGGNLKYKAADYLERPGYMNQGVTYEYLEFAVGIPYIDDADDREKLGDSYYELAVKAYKDSGARQSEVDKALADLENAIAALDITNLASEWEIVRLESALDAASAFKEGDYRNNAAWKNLLAAIEDAEDALASSYPGRNAVNGAYAELNKFLDQANAGTGYKLSANSVTSLKRELNSLVKEAKELLKDTTDKPSVLILSLEKAVTTAENTMDATKTAQLVSNYESATTGLTEAMDAYIEGVIPDTVTGWYYSDEAKAWFFYKEDGTEMTGWMWDASYNGWYYFREDGTMVEDCSKMIGGTWYYFWKGGKMAASAWAKGLDGKWYYYNASGAMATSSWILSSGKYYYVGSDGAMLVNTTTPDGYKVDANGVWVQ